MPEKDTTKVKVGVSACLLGQEVRYDGGHKHDRFLTEQVGRFVKFVPVCPEFELGLGVPRPTLRLEVEAEGAPVKLMETRSRRDHTGSMQAYARGRVAGLANEELSGFILKKNSPSCGLFRVGVARVAPGADPRNVPSARSGRGLFADELTRQLPLMPVEEEGRLNDAPLRESFFERVFATHRLQTLFRERWSVGDLVAFHSREKFLLLCHDEAAYRRLGRLVAGAKGRDRQELGDEYQRDFLLAMARPATVSRHVNVLQHMIGFFKTLLTPDEKREFGGVLEDYRGRLVPLIVPIILIRHYVSKYRQQYLGQQTYLEPHPPALSLRNYT